MILTCRWLLNITILNKIMPLNFTDQKKRQKYLLGVVAILLLIGGIVWFSYFKENQPFVAAPVDVSYQPQNINIDFSIFENPLLKKLNPFFQIPAFEGVTGRSNPFSK